MPLIPDATEQFALPLAVLTAAGLQAEAVYLAGRTPGIFRGLLAEYLPPLAEQVERDLQELNLQRARAGLGRVIDLVNLAYAVTQDRHLTASD